MAGKRILVFGAGGVGSIYGWFMERAGCEVTAVCRSNYEIAKIHGLTIRSAKWGTHVSRPRIAKSVEEAATFGPFDFILVCSKAFPDTHELIKDAVSPGTAIVLAQNGINIEAAYHEAYPDNPIISGVVYLPAMQVAPAVVEHSTPLQLFEIGTYPTESDETSQAKLDELQRLWTAAGATAVIYDDVQTQRWNKLALNATLNPVCALTLCDDANFFRSSTGAADVARDIMREVSRVAVAAGYNNVTEDLIEEHMKRHIGRLDTGGKDPSMLQDARAGKAMEVEAILGNTVRMAEEYKVQTPYLRLLYTLAKGLNFSLERDETWRPAATVQ